MRKRAYVRVMSVLVSWAMTINSAAFAAQPPLVASAPAMAPGKIAVQDVLKLKIPGSWGLIREVHNAAANKVIINIQDAHCDFDAQQNIAKIIDRLVSVYHVKLVAVEGAAGRVSNPVLEAFPDKKIVRNVASYFMKEGKLTGPEYLAATVDYELNLVGVEDPKLYFANLDAFQKSQPYKAELKLALRSVRQLFDQLKPSIYNDALKNFDQLRTSYEQHQISFGEYCRQLYQVMTVQNLKRQNYPHFYALQKAIRLEKDLDLKKADAQRAELLNALTEQINRKEDLADLVGNSIDFKKGLISAGQFANFLRDLAFKYRLNLSAYGHFVRYAEYITEYERVANATLFDEIDAIERAVSESYYTADNQRGFDAMVDYLKLLDKLVDLELVRDDYHRFQAAREAITIDGMRSFLIEQAAAYNLRLAPPKELAALEAYAPAWVKFYELAVQRDRVFVDQTLAQMQQYNSPGAVLVTGGFHTPKLTEFFKEEKISYLVVTPRISETGDNPYLSIMRGDTTFSRELLKQITGTLNVWNSGAFSEAATQGLSEELAATLKSENAGTQRTLAMGIVGATFDAIAQQSEGNHDVDALRSQTANMLNPEIVGLGTMTQATLPSMNDATVETRAAVVTAVKSAQTEVAAEQQKNTTPLAHTAIVEKVAEKIQALVDTGEIAVDPAQMAEAIVTQGAQTISNSMGFSLQAAKVEQKAVLVNAVVSEDVADKLVSAISVAVSSLDVTDDAAVKGVAASAMTDAGIADADQAKLAPIVQSAVVAIKRAENSVQEFKSFVSAVVKSLDVQVNTNQTVTTILVDQEKQPVAMLSASQELIPMTAMERADTNVAERTTADTSYNIALAATPEAQLSIMADSIIKVSGVQSDRALVFQVIDAVLSEVQGKNTEPDKLKAAVQQKMEAAYSSIGTEVISAVVGAVVDATIKTLSDKGAIAIQSMVSAPVVALVKADVAPVKAAVASAGVATEVQDKVATAIQDA
ncbi:MAG: hypothetical protein NC924_06390, partial [Candidatus Omnitrophica bacterium]|nr:hypothetical protein [Candidatus Omnitrophota bacterium]